MTDTQQHEARLREVAAAWQELATNKAFSTILEKDLQFRWPVFGAAFDSGDNYNPHAAAQRDGRREVVTYLWAQQRRVLSQQDKDEDDTTQRSNKAKV
jgi:hypothetical protein